MFGLELARPPASTKPLEVKLAHQESELVSLLKKIPLGKERMERKYKRLSSKHIKCFLLTISGPSEMELIRERARQLRDGTLRSRGDALLPQMLASYIFECLVTNNQDPFIASDEQVRSSKPYV